MKLLVEKYKMTKVKESNVEVNIPDEPYYCFETHIRRSIRIIPKFWEEDDYAPINIKKGDLISLEVTCVYLSSECNIELFNIDISSIQDLISKPDPSKQSQLVNNILLNKWGDIRTKEQFDTDLNTAIKKIIQKNG